MRRLHNGTELPQCISILSIYSLGAEERWRRLSSERQLPCSNTSYKSRWRTASSPAPRSSSESVNDAVRNLFFLQAHSSLNTPGLVPDWLLTLKERVASVQSGQFVTFGLGSLRSAGLIRLIWRPIKHQFHPLDSPLEGSFSESADRCGHCDGSPDGSGWFHGCTVGRLRVKRLEINNEAEYLKNWVEIL